MAKNTPGFHFGFSPGPLKPLREVFRFRASNTNLSTGYASERYYVGGSGGLDGEAVVRISFGRGGARSVNSFDVYEITRHYWVLYYLLLATVIMFTLWAFWIWGHWTGFSAALLFMITLVAYKAVVVMAYGVGDNTWYVKVTRNIIYHGDARLNIDSDDQLPFKGPDDSVTTGHGRRINQYTYQNASGAFYNLYPLGVSLAILPIVALEIPMGLDWYETYITTAIVLAAFSVMLLFLVSTALNTGIAQSLALSIVFAFTTTHFSHHTTGIWSHSVTLAISLISVLLLLRNSTMATLSLAPFTSLAVASRPDYVFFAACFAVYIFWRQRRLAVPYVLLSLLFFAPIVVWNTVAFGTIIPPYYQNQTDFVGAPLRIIERLVSPNRGIFIFNPIFLFSFIGAALVWRKKEYHPIFKMAGACFILHTLFTALINGVGGWSYGPRLNAATMGYMALLLIPVWDCIKTLGRPLRVLVSSIALCFVFWGFFVHLKGVVNWEVHKWNASPCDVMFYPERAWDWNDMQIFRTGQINNSIASGELIISSCPQ
ncbi:MAG: hypothetical protein OEZ32_10655 [Nitrospinota bacterium]|nr:hypothetical protein [Nitrospinota bacterium]